MAACNNPFFLRVHCFWCGLHFDTAQGKLRDWFLFLYGAVIFFLYSESSS